MSTIDIRKIVNTKYRVRLRPIKLHELSLTFSDLETAKKWVEEHENSYIDNPVAYQDWIIANRKSLKEKGIYHEHIPLEKFI